MSIDQDDRQVPTQYELLGRDIPYLAGLALSKPDLLFRAADHVDPYERCYLIAICDLFWQVQHCAAAVHAILPHDLDSPLLIIQRGLYEATVALRYLG